MRRDTIRRAVVALALACVLLPARADYDAGRRALEAGRPGEALVQWQAAAQAGDRRAMLALGRLHARGLGVAEDRVEAHKWLDLAARLGEAAAPAQRDALAADMTPAQLAEARARAAAWRPGGARSAVPSPHTTREVQALLAGLGYSPGPLDGIWGPRTERAYQAFLGDAGLPVAQVSITRAMQAMRTIAKRLGVEPAETVPAAPSEAPAPAAPTVPAPAATRPAAAPAVPAPAAARPSAAPGVPAPAPAAPRPAAAPHVPALAPAALHRAVRRGDLAGVETALAGGVAVNARDGRGWTALMHAANEGLPRLVERLLAAEADPDLRAPDGATALVMAAGHGHAETVALLVGAGAAVSAPGPEGRTAADVARDRADVDLIRALGLAFRDCPECPELVVVPSGSYEMGSPGSEDGWSGAEGPVHRVTIAEPFAVGMYEVTFSQWDACVADGGCGGYRPDDEGWGRGDRPVVNVSWKDAQGYVDWLTRRTGERYRLPSESEWEYAARAGTTTPFHTGSTISTEQANYDGSQTYGAGRAGRYRKRTVPAGGFAPNRFGLHDVHGNAWEWVEDCWNDSYRGAPSDGSAWESGSCKSRVLRGGSWNVEPSDLRSAFRVRNTTGARFDASGIRVVRALAP